MTEEKRQPRRRSNRRSNMSDEEWESNRRFWDNPIGVVYNPDGSLATGEGIPKYTKRQIEIIEARSEAMRMYRLTGDRSYMVEVGLFPTEDDDDMVDST